MAGYSGTPLVGKLGIKPGYRLALLGSPPAAARLLAPLPEGVGLVGPRASEVDCILLFSRSTADLARRFGLAAKRLTTAGMLWICWPKKTSGVATDLSEAEIRAIGLAAGLVDVKVCAVDDTWSGLKFVRRLRDR